MLSREGGWHTARTLLNIYLTRYLLNIKMVTIGRPIEVSTDHSGIGLLLFKGREFLKEESGAPAMSLTSLPLLATYITSSACFLT